MLSTFLCSMISSVLLHVHEHWCVVKVTAGSISSFREIFQPSTTICTPSSYFCLNFFNGLKCQLYFVTVFVIMIDFLFSFLHSVKKGPLMSIADIVFVSKIVINIWANKHISFTLPPPNHRGLHTSDLVSQRKTNSLGLEARKRALNWPCWTQLLSRVMCLHLAPAFLLVFNWIESG